MAFSALKVISALVLLLGIVLAQIWVFSLDFDTRGKILRAQIVVIIQSFLLLGDFVVWKNIADVFDRDQSTRDNRRSTNHIWRYCIITFFIFVHSSYMCNVLLVRTEPAIFAMFTYLMLAIEVQLITALLIFYLMNLMLKYMGKKPIKKSRKTLISIIYAVIAVTLGFLHAQGPPVIKSVEIPVKDLPSKLEGFTITQISDIHLGPTVGKSKFDRIVKLVNELQSGTLKHYLYYQSNIITAVFPFMQ